MLFYIFNIYIDYHIVVNLPEIHFVHHLSMYSEGCADPAEPLQN